MTWDGIHISATCVLRQIELLVSWDEIFISVLRMLKRQHIGDLFAPFWNMAAVFGIPKVLFFNKKSKKVQNRAARFVTSNYSFETGSMTGILENLKWESLKKRRRDIRLILLYKGLKGAACIPTDDFIPPIKRSRNHHSLTFQTPATRTDIYNGSFFPQTIRDWNALPDSIITSAERAPLWWELGTNFPYHRSWWMKIIRRITSKHSDSDRP